MLNKCKDWRPEPQHPPKFGKTQWATRNSGTWNGEARNHNSKMERWTELWTNSITVLWGRLRAPCLRVESNGGRLLTPVLAVHRHVNTHASTPAPTQANALAHTPHTHVHGQNFSTARLHSPGPLSLRLFCSHASTPPQLLRGWCMLAGG